MVASTTPPGRGSDSVGGGRFVGAGCDRYLTYNLTLRRGCDRKTRRRSATLEARVALLEERGHRLLRVGRGEVDRLSLRLRFERLCERGRERLLQQLLARTERD